MVAYVDAAAGATWGRLLGVFPRGPDGTFSLLLRPEWTAAQYRVTLYGPNVGWAFAPDDRTVIDTP